MKDQLITAMADMEEAEALRLASAMLAAGQEPQEILDACGAAMARIGKRYETGEYFLPELILAGEMMKQIAALVKPKLRREAAQPRRLGKVLIGTVAGDIHDIGKDVVAFMLDANHFEVKDLGVDVPAATFVDAIREFQPDIVGMSGFLTMAFDQMKATIEAIQAAGLRERVKIMIGGSIMDTNAAAYAGADAYGPDAPAAVKLAKGWMGVQ